MLASWLIDPNSTFIDLLTTLVIENFQAGNISIRALHTAQGTIYEALTVGCLLLGVTTI